MFPYLIEIFSITRREKFTAISHRNFCYYKEGEVLRIDIKDGECTLQKIIVDKKILIEGETEEFTLIEGFF